MNQEKMKEKIALDLFKLNAVMFGNFKLKSGIMSPFYVDLRLSISSPKLLNLVGKALHSKSRKLKFNRVCGIPFAGIPFGVVVSLNSNKPMILLRLQVKGHGTKKLIEGQFKKGEKILLVDDLITTGLSKFESIYSLKNSGLKVTDIVVLIDRMQSAGPILKKKNVRLHSFMTIKELFSILLKKNKITKEQFEKSMDFVDGL